MEKKWRKKSWQNFKKNCDQPKKNMTKPKKEEKKWPNYNKKIEKKQQEQKIGNKLKK